MQSRWLQGVSTVLVVFGASACLTQEQLASLQTAWVQKIPLTAEEQGGLDTALATGSRVEIPKAQSEDAWGRANVWVSQNASMKIQVSSNFIVETYNPREFAQFGYSVSRSPGKDTDVIEVRCMAGDRFGNADTGNLTTSGMLTRLKVDCTNNSALAGHFIKTGEDLCRRCVAK